MIHYILFNIKILNIKFKALYKITKMIYNNE